MANGVYGQVSRMVSKNLQRCLEKIREEIKKYNS